MTQRAKKWVFTLNNYTQEEVDFLKSLDVKYIGWGYEVGESGTPHLQGFVWFKKQLRFNAAKAIMGTERIHLEVQRGDLADNLNYCTKENGEFWQSCKPPNEHKTEYRDIIKMSLEEADAVMAEEHTWAMGSSNWQRLRAGMIKPYSGEMEVKWYWGPKGSGKTRTAKDEVGENFLDFDGKMFETEGGHEGVILDEIDKDGGKMPIGVLLRLTDRYKFRMRMLYRFQWRDFKKIIITSTVHPSVLYSEHFEQIERRITEIREFN